MAQRAKLDSQAKLLLAMNALFLVSTALSNTFVNIYLWKLKQDYVMIGIFNLFYAIAMPLAFWLAGHLVKKMDRVKSIRLGVAAMAVFYLVVLALGETSPRYIGWLGIFLGIGSGFYWLGYNVMYFEITNPFNRDMFNGVNGFLASGAGMVAPFLSGWLLSRMNEWTGYRLIFSLSLAIFLFAVLVSFFIRGRKAEGALMLKEVWRDSLRRSYWHDVLFAHFFQGIREGVFTFLIGLLVFIATSSEFKLGVYTFLTSAVSLFAYYAIGRWITPERRHTFLLIGAVMLTVVVLPLFLKVNYATLLILGIGSALFFPFFAIPMTSTTFDVIGENERKASLRVEYIVIREAALNLGRLLSISLFIATVAYTRKPLFLTLLLLVTNGGLLFSWIFMKRVPYAFTPQGRKGEDVHLFEYRTVYDAVPSLFRVRSRREG
ncbi:MFS transporter [Bacillaceae bacterium]